MKPVPSSESNTLTRGFSLIEMMVVVVIVTIVVAAVLGQVNQVQQRATAEQGKLDEFQDARTFLGQIATDARQMGFPNSHSFDTTAPPALTPSCGPAAWQAPLMDDCRISAGLVEVTPTQLIFEGDVDGSGSISIVSYAINGDGQCATCLERAQVFKQSVSGLSSAAYLNNDQNAVANAFANGLATEIQHVQNTNSVFKAYDYNGIPVTLPVDITSNNGTTIATIRAIQISINVSDPSKLDPKTRQPLEANITSQVQIVNCSMATTSSALTAAGIQQVAGGIQLACRP